MSDVLQVKFLLYARVPIATMIIKQEIYGFHYIPCSGNWSYKLSNILLLFYKKTKRHFKFPEKLEKTLKSALPFSEQGIEWDRSITGECNDTDGCCLGISFDISIEKGKNPLIHFTSFEIEKHPIDISFSFRIEDTFLILSNLVVYHELGRLFRVGDYTSPFHFDYENTISYIEAVTNKDVGFTIEPHKPFMKYACEYTQYIKQNIENGKIAPKEILETGGVDVLYSLRDEPIVSKFLESLINSLLVLKNTDNYSFQEKAAYLTLIYAFDCNEFVISKDKKYEEISKKLVNLHKKLKKPFPDRGARWYKFDTL